MTLKGMDSKEAATMMAKAQDSSSRAGWISMGDRISMAARTRVSMGRARI